MESVPGFVPELLRADGIGLFCPFAGFLPVSQLSWWDPPSVSMYLPGWSVSGACLSC
jgi:hypothetical protein